MVQVSTPVIEMPRQHWHGAAPDGAEAGAMAAIESGAVLFFPRLSFDLLPEEHRFLSDGWSDGKSKNISFDTANGRIKGAAGTQGELEALGRMIGRYAASARNLIAALFPSYEHVVVERTSFRPFGAEERETSWRKDDRLLHIDAFPSRPNRGARILRVFHNANRFGEPRVWCIGEPFAHVAARFLPALPAPLPGTAALLSMLGVTKGMRSRYDHLMLRLHDRMKSDADYQRNAPRTQLAFPAGSTWVCFSDQVSHAVVRGRFLLEQTLKLPVAAMREPDRAPIRVLERLAERALA